MTRPAPLSAWEREILAKGWGTPARRAALEARVRAIEAVHLAECREQTAAFLAGVPLSDRAARAVGLVRSGNPKAWQVIEDLGEPLVAEVRAELARLSAAEARAEAERALAEIERAEHAAAEETRTSRG